jgi:hypothetical protein
VKMLRAALDGNDTQMRLAEAMYERQQQANP